MKLSLPCILALALSALVSTAAAQGLLPRDESGRPLNLDFETGTLADWTIEGEAFADQPIQGDTVRQRREDMRSRHQGEFWIGGYERHLDAPTGTLTSAPFIATKPWASFLANGGSHGETHVELVRQDTDEVFYRVAGNNQETMRRVVVDLRPHAGKPIYVRLVDEHRGGWGHVNFDNFRLHDTRPGRPTPPLVILTPDEYPLAGVSGDQAARAMQLPEGFSVTASATEPEVKQPIAMALDDRGRVWIAEAYEYPIRAPEGEGRDRILIFEDNDGDGRFDRRTVFAEGLNLVSGLEVGFGGVWVGAAPHLLFIPDRDGDDRPDGEPQVLLDGWGYEDTHETLNAFIWGPDGWLYGCHGIFTHSLVGEPGTPEDKRVPLNAAIWRYHPVRHTFEVFAEGTSNPWGVDFNDHGQAFCTACVIPHLFHVIQGARYQRQAGQHFNQYTYRDITTIADHVHYLGANPHGGNDKSDAAGGGHAHAGAMIYLGNAWPERYRGQIFMNNIHGQRLNVDILEPQGSGYVGQHAPDFLLTGDRASQILNLRYGPDGQAYMIDWYDMNACHHRDPNGHDRSNGRIYKITYGQSEPVDVDLKKLADGELVELVLHQNDWYVRHSRRILQERAARGELDDSARGRLAELATTHADETRRLRAAWALHVTGGLSNELLSKLLADANAYVRGWAIQLSLDGENLQATPALLSQFATMAREDQSQVVRLYLASALQRLPLDARWDILDGLVRHPEDAGDHNLPLMLWYAAEPLAGADSERALALGMVAGESIPLVRELMLRRIGSSGGQASLAVLVRGLDGADDSALQLTFLQGIRSALRGQRQVEPPDGWQAAFEKLTASSDQSVALAAAALAATFGNDAAKGTLAAIAADSQRDTASRREAVETLLAVRAADLPALLKPLVSDVELRDLAIRGLAQFDDPQTPAILLEAYSHLPPAEKRSALATLCARPEFGLALLEAVKDKQIASSDLTADLVRQLRNLKDSRVDARLESVWGTVRETAADKQQMIAAYKQMLTDSSAPNPDPELGRAIFAKTCQQCHTLFGTGGNVGPDLTGSNRSDLDYLLSNIVDPASVMAKEYQPTVIATVDGRIVTGIVRAEDDRALTLQTATETLVVPQDEVEQRAMSDQSMMPDDQLKQFTDQEIRSLVAYLAGLRQVPLLATVDNAAQVFNGQDLTGWTGSADLWSVQDGQIVGRSPGLPNNEFLVSDLAVEDFRLTLQVKLIKNEGNSGIQFRSAPIDGGVKGYQADIGVDWWGKLYEEHGRALLWAESGEQHVRQGEWNEYTVEADGPRIRTWINGQLCVDLNDPEGARRGILAFQLHSGPAMEVRFRDFNLEVLDRPADAAP
ncbi:MAG: PVC-type heme-binding CxxCH protein [Pirellulales bacterium]